MYNSKAEQALRELIADTRAETLTKEQQVDLDDAVSELVMDTMAAAARRQGQVIAAALAGNLTWWIDSEPWWSPTDEEMEDA
jgi:hypothetical protein